MMKLKSVKKKSKPWIYVAIKWQDCDFVHSEKTGQSLFFFFGGPRYPTVVSDYSQLRHKIPSGRLSKGKCQEDYTE